MMEVSLVEWRCPEIKHFILASFMYLNLVFFYCRIGVIANVFGWFKAIFITSNDLPNRLKAMLCWTDMILLYSEASYRSWEGL